MNAKPALPSRPAHIPPHALTPREKEVHLLFARGKTVDSIAIRLNIKLSKVLAMLALMPKP